MTKYDVCFDLTIGHEGAYVNNKDDPGGETNLGISRRAYPNEDIKGMTLDRAKFLYKRDYWDKVQGDSLPGPIALLVFDGAVNAGVSRSARWLQMAAGVAADGAIGPKTLAAVKASKPAPLMTEYLAQRNLHNASLDTWDTFGKGWSRRLFALPFQAMQVPL